MTTRKLMQTTAAALALAAIAAAADAEPLKIGVIESLSGAQTSTGRLFLAGVEYVVDRQNAEGGFNGAPIELIEYDNAGGTTEAADKFKQAVADGVHVIFQGASSAIGGQVTEDVRKHNLRNRGNEVLYVNGGAEAMELTGEKCHFHHFRFGLTAPMRVNALVAAMKQAGDLGGRVYAINQNYSWGQDMEDAVRSAASDGDYEVVDAVLHEVNRIQDFSPFVAKIKAAQPDTVITGNWSNDLLLLMKASGEAGLDVRFGTMFLDQVGNIANAGPTAEGHYVAHSFNAAAADNDYPEDYKAVTGHYPVFVEPQATHATEMLVAALGTVDFGGGEIDVNAIGGALEEVEIETGIGPMRIRKEDHQAIRPVVVSKVTSTAVFKADGTDLGFEPVAVIQGEDAIYPVQASCDMRRPS